MLNYFQRNSVYCHSPYVMYNYWQFPNYQYPYPLRNKNDVDVTIFSESLASYRQLLKDASNVLNHLANSKSFAAQVMGAAEVSNQKEVDRLIKSLGIKSNFQVTYNPDGIHLRFWTKAQGTECCKLDMAIRWR